MRIAFLHDWLLTWRGGEKCLEALLEDYPDAEIFTIFSSDNLIRKKLSGIKVHSSFLSKLPFVAYYYRFLFPFYPLAIYHLSSLLKRRHKDQKFDLLLSISHCAIKNVKAPKGLKHICYCLTPVRYIWDQFDNYFHDKWYRPIVALLRTPFQYWDRVTAANVTQFIAISDFVKERIKRYYDRESIVIYPPVSIERFLKLEKEGGDHPFYLMVNALVPYKRTDVVVSAFNQSGRQLVVVGDGPDFEMLKKKAKSNVQLLGWVSDPKLETLYQKCEGLIYLALEDFGIAPVEAQAAGKPVICLKKGGCAETVVFYLGDFEKNRASGIEVKEDTASSLLDALIRFESLNSKGYFDPENCKISAKRFSVAKFKENFKKVIAQC